MYVTPRKKKILALVAGAVVLLGVSVAAAGSANAASVVITPSTPQGWRADDTNTLPTFSSEQTHLGAASLKFSVAATSDHVAYCHDLPAGTTLAQFQQASYDYYKLAGGPAATYNLSIDTNGSAPSTDTAGFVSLFYSPDLNGTVPLNTWAASGDLTSTSQWVSTRPARTGGVEQQSFNDFQTAFGDATALYICANLGSGQADGTTYVDNVAYQGNFNDFEKDATTTATTVTRQGLATQTFAQLGNPALGSVKVETWVDIRRTETRTGTVVSRSYAARGHTRFTEVSGVLRDQVTLARLGAPGVILNDNTAVVNSGTSEPAVAEQASLYVNVDAGTSCDNPVTLQARGTGDVRWTNGRLSQGVTLLSSRTTSEVCVPSSK